MAESEAIHPLRKGLVALSALGVAGTLVELAILRHWNTWPEVIPWIVLVLAGLAVVALWARPGRSTVWIAAITGLALAVSGVYGLVAHVVANMQAAPLDGTVGPTWEGLALWRQVWLASTGGVGPAPPLSAASLTPTGLALALATVRHPESSRKWRSTV